MEGKGGGRERLKKWSEHGGQRVSTNGYVCEVECVRMCSSLSVVSKVYVCAICEQSVWRK